MFPSLCLSAAGPDFEDTACAAGFSDALTDTLEGEYQVRFFILEAMGALENLLHRE